ncbi:MAG: hypothetical protein OEM28_03405 [Nitrosopumilus sp.]|nr:hypothetical protein [Nitrosopumilus sp.]MDH3487413.1 hypothetical protein [Nitrosopumilus sp.]
MAMLEKTRKRDLDDKKIEKFHAKKTKFYNNYEMIFEESLRDAMGQGW